MTDQERADVVRELEQSIPIRAVQLLRPQDGDIVLISLPDNTTVANRRQVARSFQEACGRKVKVAVLPSSFAVRVVRVEDIPPDAICDNTPIIRPGESSML